MILDVGKTVDTFKEGTEAFAEIAHKKTNEFHENYVSKVIPDCGKYGDAAKFAAEMVPGVEEYNAIREGDWYAFAISAGIDIASLAIGAATAGTGFAAIKGSSAAAKAGAKKAAKEIAEAGAEKIAKEVVETGAEKITKELAEAGAEKIAKEAVEAGAEKAVKEAAESGIEKTVKETIETAAEKAMNPEILDQVSPVVRRKLEGTAREEKVLSELLQKFKNEDVIREALIRDANGNPIKDVITGEARRIDFIVKAGDKVTHSIEVTSETASKALQVAKETRIREVAEKIGGAFIKDPSTGNLISFGIDIATEIRRLA